LTDLMTSVGLEFTLALDTDPNYCELPEGAPESNYLRTIPGKGWFTLLRLYSPTQPFFNGSWRPNDFEKLDDERRKYDFDRCLKGDFR